MGAVTIYPAGFEVDHAKSEGAIPYIPGNLLMGTYTIGNASSSIYIVPDNNVLHVSKILIQRNETYGTRSLSVYNANDAIVMILYSDTVPINSANVNIFIDFHLPLVLLEGYYLRVVSTGSGCITITNVYGYLVPFIST